MLRPSLRCARRDPTTARRQAGKATRFALALPLAALLTGCGRRAPTAAPEPRPEDTPASTPVRPEPAPRCPPIAGCVPRQVFTAHNTSYVLVDPERLPTEQEPRLRGFIADYGAICGGLIVRVIGHRGADEPAGASLNRAQTVHRALVAGGIPPACAELDDAATTDPIAREDDPRKLNRRVDLQLWHE